MALRSNPKEGFMRNIVLVVTIMLSINGLSQANMWGAMSQASGPWYSTTPQACDSRINSAKPGTSAHHDWESITPECGGGATTPECPQNLFWYCRKVSGAAWCEILVSVVTGAGCTALGGGYTGGAACTIVTYPVSGFFCDGRECGCFSYP